MATIANIITNGYLSVPISANYNAKQELYSAALAAPQSPVLINIVTDALFWMNDGGNYTTAELSAVANYLVWLCGKFGLTASQISGAGGGSVVPIPSGGLTPSRSDFYVSATSLIPTGTTSITLSQYIGYEIDFVRGGISQSTISSEPSYFTWTKSTGAFTCSPALQEGELISIIPTV